jgi:hypothetical protein
MTYGYPVGSQFMIKTVSVGENGHVTGGMPTGSRIT